MPHFNYRRHERPAAASFPLEGTTAINRFEVARAEARQVLMPRMKTPCRLWTRGTCSGGYGLLSLAGGGGAANGQILIRAHVLAYRLDRLAGGAIPDGQQVNHVCDQRLCIAEDHHYLGDHQMNMSDLRRRGSWAQQRAAIAAHWR